MAKTNFLIDGSNLAYRQYYGIQKSLSTSVGDPSDIIFGFFRSLLKLKREFKQADFWVAWDGVNNERRRLFSGYKAQRKTTDDKKIIHEQIEILKKLIPFCGIGSVYLEDQEADDIIAALAVKYFKGGLNYIYANDKDYLQLVKDGSIIVLMPRKGENRAYDEDAVLEEFNVPVEQVLHFRALDGDSSDNIPRVPYLKKATIVDIIKRYDTIDILYNSTFSGIKISDYNKLKGFEKQAKTNLQLMRLNTSLELEDQIEKPPFNLKELEAAFEKYELKTLLIKIDEFAREFGGMDGFMKTGIQQISL